MKKANKSREQITIIGAGVGGLAAAIKLANEGYQVTVLEARSEAGGLASGFLEQGFSFDAGPYILLDKPGLKWAFEQLGIDLENSLSLIPIKHILHILSDNDTEVAFETDLEETSAGFERQFPGSAAAYQQFVARTFKIHQQLQPLTLLSRPKPWDLIKIGAWSCIPFLLQSLGGILKKASLPTPIQQGISIWTYIAGQPVNKAPAPMAFVPGLFHHIGSFYPKGGMQAIAKVLSEKAKDLGVRFRFDTAVDKIHTQNGKVSGLTTTNGERINTTLVISNAAGVGTYLQLLDKLDVQPKTQLAQLPLQSPGVCIYLAVKGKNPPYYLRFKMNEDSCIAFIQPGVMDESLNKDGWYPARLIAPLNHALAAALGEEGQKELMTAMLHDDWWQQNITEYKVLRCRSTFEWGSSYNLYKDSMNPVMTAEFMRKGRIAHRSPHVKGLYLTGSATHPGQWLSFCAISGVLAAQCVINDSGHA